MNKRVLAALKKRCKGIPFARNLELLLPWARVVEGKGLGRFHVCRQTVLRKMGILMKRVVVKVRGYGDG